ncbi:MAG: chorismate-binding protein, partial [Acidimicrobiia bacterium]|nr:chorismate-binding protein [Acidimicrobiia bacterium]NNL26908.1 aminodeoxychorismate synthase, component I [Acidimicrobiia bacterium]
VDLLRNDVGKLARVGTVTAAPLFELERYETVWQLTSTIRAELGSNTRLRDVFTGLFPSGSITGAPKARTTEIIDELELDPRGVYCGAIGLVSPSDEGLDAEFNVAIRTVTIDAATSIAEFGVGGGITWDSTSAGEYQEALWKTAVLDGVKRDFGLFETLRWDHEYLFLDRHLNRLCSSAAYFEFPCTRPDLEMALKSVSRELTAPTRVRLELAADGGVLATASGALPRFATGIQDADEVTVELAGTAVQPHDRMLFHKTTDRTTYELAMSEVTSQEALLTNAYGEITESTISNVVLLLDGIWFTPPLESGCLPGVYRQHLLEQGQIVERVLRREDLLSSEMIGLVNSVRGWRRALLA